MLLSTAFFTIVTFTLLEFVAAKSGVRVPTPVPCVVETATFEQQKALNDKFNEQFYVTRDIVGAYSHVAADYINHKPDITDGQLVSFNFVYPLLDASNSNSSDITMEILRTAFEPPYAWVHWRADGFLERPTAIFDIYRWNGTCIVEHWDAIEEVPENPVSSHPVF
ncbi:Snoal-like polyketide cyclase family protein [Favolaschia claudopus]|uniref:Snoal-like polyketide cyclase family protein n=1 Tax=Favolaschia claudopus TaxID=2862362 RepID=A0AAW0CM25_9AGAR